MQFPSKPEAGIKARLVQWWSNQDSHIVDLLRGASIAGVLKAFAAILAFGLSVVLGRVLGADATGVYFLALTAATIAATIGRFGLDSAVLRFVATHASAGKWAEVGKVYRTTLAIGLICSCVVAVALYLAADILAEIVFEDSKLSTPMRIIAVAVVPLSLGVLISYALLGLSRIRESVLVFSILPMGITLLGTWILAPMWAVNGAMVAYVAAVTAALVYGSLAWRRALLGRDQFQDSQKAIASPTRELLATGAPLLLGALLQLVMQASGTLMLGIWSDNSDVSLYSVAWRTATVISFVLLAVNTIAQPKFAELYARGDLERLAATAHKATLFMVICAAPVFLLFLVAPNFVMSVFGDEFSGGAATLQVLSVGQFVNVAMGSVGVLLVMSAREKEYRNVQIVSAIVVLSLNFALIPEHGAIGAAIAAAAALIVQNVLFGYFVWSRLGILTIVSRSIRNPKAGNAQRKWSK